MSRRYAVVGTGALGGFYGGCLAKAGVEVHFLMRSDAQVARERGLRVDSKSHGVFKVHPARVYERAEVMPVCDVVLVCLKTTANEALRELLPSVMGPETTVVMMQNGLGVEGDAAAVVGGDRVLGGLCFVCCNKVGPAEVVHLDYGDVRLGRYRADGSAGGVDEVMEGVAADFGAAGIEVRLIEDLVLARWQKLVWNVPYNGLSVVLGVTTDVIMGDPGLRRMAEALMMEVAAAARGAAGRAIDAGFIREMLERTERMRPYRPSMLVDREQGRALEAGSIFGAPLAAARGAGVETPRLELLAAQVAVLAERVEAVRG
ncbi:MAG: putative 2-dehydropantoate 2-reductase [Phycisphaeraceae bacterium]